MAEPEVFRGHGTGNDFVLIADYEGNLDLDVNSVRRLTDRHRGLGGDGLIRVVRTSHVYPDQAPDSEWFMDYRNADGSVAEICGNGVRVFAHYLIVMGLVSGTDPIRVGTRAGVKPVSVVPNPYGHAGNWYRVEMGRWHIVAGEDPSAAPTVATAGIAVDRPSLAIDMGNPHNVVALSGLDELLAADLSSPPVVSPDPPEGSNIEYIVLDPDAAGLRLHMRVHERGAGETLACGSGACAAAVAATRWAGADSAGDWRVDQPGGPVRVEVSPEHVWLSGPAELIGQIGLQGSLAEVLAQP